MKKRGFRKRPRRKSTSFGALKKQVQNIMYITRPYKQYTKLSGLTGNVSSIASSYDLTQDIQQGDSEQQRENLAIYVKSIYLDFALLPGDTYNNIRVCLVSPRQYGTTQAPGTGLPGVPTISGPWDLTRWRVHYDRRFTLTYAAVDAGTAYPKVATVSKYIPLNKRLIYETTTGGANMPIYWWVVSDSGVVPMPTVDICTIRFSFRDM